MEYLLPIQAQVSINAHFSCNQTSASSILSSSIQEDTCPSFIVLTMCQEHHQVRAESKPQCQVILTRKPRKLTGVLCFPAQPLAYLVAHFSLSLFSSFSSHGHKKRTLSMFSPSPRPAPSSKWEESTNQTQKKKENNGSRDMISHKACLAFFLFANHIRC